MTDHIDVPVRDGVIRLGQFLKLADLADDGAQARTLLAEGDVSVNGETETRRGRHLVTDDVVAVSRPAGAVTARVAGPIA